MISKGIDFKDFIYSFSLVMQLDKHNIQLDDQLDVIMQWDSLAVVRAAVFFENELSVFVSAHEISRCVTVGDLFFLSREAE